ncbi:MAG TPA: ATP-binding cassette domain-containing protein, partial [Kiritimatiellia bacterium]|nr:ATP-binding cassette domain-containing protein [Kiritimatiellia bacterium]
MIRVTHLTKRFAGCVAVDDVSFRIEPGEVVGFLGVNGAGKTTTLRILSCYLPATSGTAEVAGFDVFRDSLEVRRRIGYLPENAPLYPEMRVDEYLRFRARLKGVSPAACRRRVQEVKDRCGLKDAGRRIIGQLSRGYRQRVGLADCLVHDPELLILDEPTLGLDPAQVIQVRELIRALARRHTILLSTHILPEVEAVCRRVLIINRGRIVASDSPGQLRENLQSGARAVTEIAGPADEVRRG